MRSMLRAPRVCRFAFGGLFALASLLAVSPASFGQQLSVGPNINMVGGPASVKDGSPFEIHGDPYLQRQNEPSIACSSRNPVNCLAAANDYRLVGTRGVADGRVTGDAWIGLFWSRDEGATWRSTLLPGFNQDTSTPASPVFGLDAAADPTVRAGTNGLFYVSGVAFNRSGETTSGGGGKTGAMFVSLLIDDNNTQTADAPIRYVRTVVVDNGSNGQFLDKPWMAVDLRRGGSATCAIPGPSGADPQVVQAGPVYVAYSTFLGSGNNQHSKILFTRSLDCGATWSNPAKLNESLGVTSQSAMVTVNPQTGAILVAWRQFGDPNFSDPSRILVALSTDGGQTFTKGVQVADLGLQNPPPVAGQPQVYRTLGFDQPTLPTTGDPAPTARMFRTNGYPSVCADTTGQTGRYWLAWSQRTPTPTDDSRVLVSTSTDGLTWSAPTLADPDYTGRGHQFMPSVACTADRATVLWYDQRNDNAAVVFGPLLFGYWVIDMISQPPVHTIDVRATTSALPNAAGRLFDPSVQVSRYQGAIDRTRTPAALVQLEFNPVNWPLYAGGSVPFLGDYIDLAPARTFKPPMTTGGAWTYYDNADDTGVLHAAWTDNRDIIRPAADTDWSAPWAPPAKAGCVPNLVSIKNQNVYTSRLSRGLVVGVEGNSRRVWSTTGTTATTIMRAFALFVQNATDRERRFELTTGQAPGGSGYFDLAGTGSALFATVGPRMTIARTVFVPDAQVVPVIVNVAEVAADNTLVVGGLRGSALINSDSTAPPPSSDIVSAEVYTPSISDAFIDTYANPTFINPTFINPTFINPTFINPTFINPTFINPTFINPTFINPTFINTTAENPTFINPTFINPTFINPTFINQPLVTDVSWQVTNAGNVAAGYNFGAVLASIPSNATFQLLVNRVYRTPGSTDCGLGEQVNADLLAVVEKPAFAAASGGNPDPRVTNVTFALPAGDMAVVTLRVIHGSGTGDTVVPTFDPNSATAVTVAQAEDPANTGKFAHLGPAISVPPAGLSVEATGPSGAVVDYLGRFDFKAVDWTGTSVSFSCLPLSGITFAIGTTTVTCTAEDADHKVGSASFPVTVTDKTAPTMSTTADLMVEATGPNGATVAFTLPTASDIVDGSGVPVTCDWASPSTFPIGATTVHCSSQDAAGNKVSVSFIVTVQDTTPPVVTVPANYTGEATSGAGRIVTYTVTANDLVDGAVAVSCAPTSGSTFALGTTTVACRASDRGGRTGSASFTITIVDTTPPRLSLPADFQVQATSMSGAVVTYGASAVDLVDGPVAPVCTPASGSLFPMGTTATTTTVICTVTDSRRNSASGSFKVTVVDTVSPVLVEVATPTSLLWSPNKTMTPVTVSGKVSDATLVSLTYAVVDEYGAIQPSGTVTTIGADGRYSVTVLLEAWRKGTDSDGRTYTINVTATDKVGNKTTASAIVKVPHN